MLAPISGIVNEVPAVLGQALLPGGNVAEVVSLDPMLAVVEIAERQLGGVKVGDRPLVRLVTGHGGEGKVRFISPTASEDAHLPGRDRDPEQRRRDPRRRDRRGRHCWLAPVPATRIPRSALTFSAEGELGVRVGRRRAAWSRSCPSRIVEDARPIWVTGIADGKRIIVQGQDFVKDGQQVEPVRRPHAAAATTS